MSEYYFAVLPQYPGTGIKGGKRTAAKRDRVARQVHPSAGYTYYYDQAEGRYKGWGYCANRGEPFDRDIAAAVQDAWRKAGVGPDGDC